MTTRASIRDVAERAGVSPVTVSNVLRGRDGRASEATRERVLEAARVLRYAPVAQPTIQSRHIRTNIIGMVFDHIDVEDYWGTTTYCGLRDGAMERNFDLLTLLRARPDWMVDAEELSFLDRRSDGFIFILPRNRDAVLKVLVEHRIPVVTCYAHNAPKGVSTVDIDNADAMRQAVAHLTQNGHQRILHLAGPQQRDDFKERLAGFAKGAKENRAQPFTMPLLHPGDVSWEQKILPYIRRHKITAVACASDNLALELSHLARENGLDIPRQLSIIGMDDLPVAGERGLTTVRFSGAEVGRMAARTLIRRIDREEDQPFQSEHHIVPVHLVERNSVARLEK